MQKLFLLYNPASGQKRKQRAEMMARIAQVFRSAGMQPELCATTHAGSAINQARAAAESGFDTVIACGGDGTANEVLNGLMSASRRPVLGVIPLGSGNLLATDLRLPRSPLLAAEALLQYKPREIQPGVVTSQTSGGTDKRYFIVAAGVGSDAELMYRTAIESKERWGRNAYFLEMARMTFHGNYPMFQVEWEDGSGKRTMEQASLVMAIRAQRFPGLLRLVNLGSSLLQPHYRLLLFRTDKVRHFLHYFASVVSGRNWAVPQVAVVESHWLRCTPPDAASDHIHAQADGELLGRAPADLYISQEVFPLLMPPESLASI